MRWMGVLAVLCSIFHAVGCYGVHENDNYYVLLPHAVALSYDLHKSFESNGYFHNKDNVDRFIMAFSHKFGGSRVSSLWFPCYAVTWFSRIVSSSANDRGKEIARVVAEDIVSKKLHRDHNLVTLHSGQLRSRL